MGIVRSDVCVGGDGDGDDIELITCRVLSANTWNSTCATIVVYSPNIVLVQRGDRVRR